MNDDPIANQIENIGIRRLAWWACFWVVMVLIGGVILGLVVKHTSDMSTRAAIALAVSGLLIGVVTSILAASSRKIMLIVFLLLPLIMSLIMFVYRTMLGSSEALPLRMIIAPLFLTAGFLVGQFSRSIRQRI